MLLQKQGKGTRAIAATVMVMGILSFLGLARPKPAVAADLTIGVPKHHVIKARVEASGPTLLFSDSPEAVQETGILYKDSIKGEGRVFVHHLNDTKRDLKLAVMVRPAAFDPVKVTWKHRGIGGPEEDFFKAARDSQKAFLEDYPVSTSTLGLIDSYEVLSEKQAAYDDAGLIIHPGQLITGMFDFHANNKLEVTVMMMETKDNVEAFAGTAKILPMDEHPLRGTFKNADLTYNITKPLRASSKKPYALSMAGAHDHYLWGVDATTGQKVENYGNYGVVYMVNYALEGDKNWALQLNPEGGAFSGYCALINKNDKLIVPLPDLSIGYSEDTNAMFTITGIPSTNGKAEGTMVWSPPGASNLPIRVFWKPLDLVK